MSPWSLKIQPRTGCGDACIVALPLLRTQRSKHCFMYMDIRSVSPKFARIRSFLFVVRMRRSLLPEPEQEQETHKSLLLPEGAGDVDGDVGPVDAELGEEYVVTDDLK